MSKDPSLRNRCVSKQEYEEQGSNHLYDKFNDYYEVEKETPSSDQPETEEFSYLNYWKKEGVDIFQKEPLVPVKDPEIQFKLEGDNIEEYDGKFVTLDFEIEKQPEEEKVEEATTTTTIAEETARYLRRKRSLITQAVQAVQPTSLLQPPPLATTSKLIPIVSAQTPSLTSLSTTVTSRTITTLTSLSPQLLNAVGNIAKTGQILTINPQMLQSTRVSAPNILNSNIILPKLTRIQPRIIRPIYKSVQPGTVVTTQQGKITQYISLGSSVNLSGLSVASTAAGAGTTKTVVAPSILNNAVIVPQNMLASKNLTFQIIPIKPDMVRQGNIILTQAKTTQG